MRLADVTRYLDDYLRVGEVPDAPGALNGLQVANTGEITRAAAAVDLCEVTVRLAAEARADLLLVHHGLFWGGPRPLTGPSYRRGGGPPPGGIPVSSGPLPLDRRPGGGENAGVAPGLGGGGRGGVGEEGGRPGGVWGGGGFGRGCPGCFSTIPPAFEPAPRPGGARGCGAAGHDAVVQRVGRRAGLGRALGSGRGGNGVAHDLRAAGLRRWGARVGGAHTERPLVRTAVDRRVRRDRGARDRHADGHEA